MGRGIEAENQKGGGGDRNDDSVLCEKDPGWWFGDKVRGGVFDDQQGLFDGVVSCQRGSQQRPRGRLR